MVSRQLNLIEPVNNASDIANAALKLLKENYNFTLPLRTISVYTSNLESATGAFQMSFFNENEKEKRLENQSTKSGKNTAINRCNGRYC